MYDDCGLDNPAQPFALFYMRSDQERLLAQSVITTIRTWQLGADSQWLRADRNQYYHLPVSVIIAIGASRDDDVGLWLNAAFNSFDQRKWEFREDCV